MERSTLASHEPSLDRGTSMFKRLAATLLVLVGFGCGPQSAPPGTSQTEAPVTPRGEALPDSLARADELLGPLALHALGTEPFWSVEITRQRIVYRDPDHLDGFIFPYAPPTTAGSRVIFEASRPDSTPHLIRVAIEQRACSDGMSDVEYRYGSEVRLDSLELRGCASFKPTR